MQGTATRNSQVRGIQTTCLTANEPPQHNAADDAGAYVAPSAQNFTTTGIMQRLGGNKPGASCHVQLHTARSDK